MSYPQHARKLGRVSIRFSISGIAIGIIVVVVVISFTMTAPSRDSCSYYSYKGSCYKFKTHVGITGSCDSGIKSSEGDCYSMHCSDYKYSFSCYKYKLYVGSSGNCSGFRSPGNYCYSTSCPGYTFRSSCYMYRRNVGISGKCPIGVKAYNGDCYYGFLGVDY